MKRREKPQKKRQKVEKTEWRPVARRRKKQGKSACGGDAEPQRHRQGADLGVAPLTI